MELSAVCVQDIVAEGREIDLRVSSMPTLLGEKLAIRVLDKENLSVRLEQLGFRDVLTFQTAAPPSAAAGRCQHLAFGSKG